MNKHHTYVNLCEDGERQLNIVELREWINALGGDWVEFVQELEVALTQLEQTQTEQTHLEQTHLEQAPTADGDEAAT